METTFSLEHILKKSLSLKLLSINTIISIFFILTLTILTGIFYLVLTFLSHHFLIPLTLQNIAILKYNTQALYAFTLLTAFYLFALFLAHTFFQSLFLAIAKQSFENHFLKPKKTLSMALKKSKYLLSTNFFWLALTIFFTVSIYFLYQTAVLTLNLSFQFIFFFSIFILALIILYLLPFFLVSYYQNFNEEKHKLLQNTFSLIKFNYSNSLTYTLFILGAIFIFSILFLSLSTIITTSSLYLDYLPLQSDNFFTSFLSLFSQLIKICAILIITIYIAWLYSFFSLSSLLLYHKRKYDDYTQTKNKRHNKILNKIKLSR